jgi:hypothetical protein
LIPKFIFEVGISTAFLAGGVYTAPSKRARGAVALILGSVVLTSGLSLVWDLQFRESSPSRYWSGVYLASQWAAGVGLAWVSNVSSVVAKATPGRPQIR